MNRSDQRFATSPCPPGYAEGVGWPGRRGLKVVGALASVAALLLPRAAEAQSVDQHIQLSLNANLLSYDSHGVSSAGSDITATDTTFGPTASGLGFELGFGLTESWLVGIQLLGSSATSGTDSPGATDLKASSYSLLPRVEYVLAPGSPVAPYLGATLGLRGSSVSGAPGAKASTSDFALGGVAGLRVFALPGFSIDPSVTLLGSTGKERLDGQSFDRGGFTFLLGVALSGWLDSGGSPPEAPSAGTSLPRSPPGFGAQSATLDTDDDGTIRSDIAVGSGRQLRLMGRPLREGKEVLVTFIDNDAESPSLSQCREIRAIIDGDEQTLSEPRPVPGASSALQVLVAPSLLQSLGNANHVANLVLCGRTWQVTRDAQLTMLKFFSHFRESAQRYGHWTASEPGADDLRRNAAER